MKRPPVTRAASIDLHAIAASPRVWRSTETPDTAQPNYLPPTYLIRQDPDQRAQVGRHLMSWPSRHDL